MKRLFAFALITLLFTSCTKENDFHGIKYPLVSDPWNWCGDTIVIWGDSHLANRIPAMLSAQLGQHVIPMAVGGETSIQARERFMARPDLWHHAQVIGMGGNNNWDSAQVSQDYDTMLSKITHGKFIIMGMMSMDVEVGWKGDPNDPARGMLNHIITEQNRTRKQKWGRHFVDILPILHKFAEKTPEDSLTVVRNVVTKSLQADFVHLNSKGEQIATSSFVSLLKSCDELDPLNSN